MENICYPVVIMGERAIAGTVQAWMAWRFVEASRRVCYAINGHRTRFEIRADNRRFHNLFASLVTLSLTQGFCKSYRNFLSRRSLCLDRIPGLFFRDGNIIGLSGLFRSPWIPLGISVGNRVLEIAGLESGSGLIMGEFP